MRIETYRGADLATVLERAGRELGPQARVLERSRIADDEGNTVEIKVACEGAATATEPRRAGGPVLHDACRRLRDAGCSPDLTERFATIAARELPPRHDLAGITRATERGIEALVPLQPAAHRSDVLFVLGPPGTGKTTTTAKLAAREERPAIWIDADGERIGAREQAEILGRHAGARVVRASDPDTLRRIVREAPRNVRVFVDTCGIGVGDDDRLERIRRLRDAVPRARAALLLPVDIHRAAARTAIERFRPLRPSCIGISRVDDDRQLGALLNTLDAVRGLDGIDLPLSFITTGHTIPDDLDEATPARLARLLLRWPGVAAQEMLV